jgi:hypothetical protein
MSQQREHYALARGFTYIECPIGRCEYKHRFPETDLTVEDSKTEERRLLWLRAHHTAGHPRKGDTPEEKLRALVFNTITMSLGDIAVPVHIRNELTTELIRVLELQ